MNGPIVEIRNGERVERRSMWCSGRRPPDGSLQIALVGTDEGKIEARLGLWDGDERPRGFDCAVVGDPDAVRSWLARTTYLGPLMASRAVVIVGDYTLAFYADGVLGPAVA